METFFNEPHLWKAPLPIETTEGGIDISTNEEQSQKELSLIKVIEDGIVISSCNSHSLKVSYSIEVREEGS